MKVGCPERGALCDRSLLRPAAALHHGKYDGELASGERGVRICSTGDVVGAGREDQAETVLTRKISDSLSRSADGMCEDKIPEIFWSRNLKTSVMRTYYRIRALDCRLDPTGYRISSRPIQ